jgi:hypothetical protein
MLPVNADTYDKPEIDVSPGSMHRHDLAVPQNATGIAEHTELEREGKPCLRSPITADDLDILGNEAVMADERLLGVRQQKQRVPLRVPSGVWLELKVA